MGGWRRQLLGAVLVLASVSPAAAESAGASAVEGSGIAEGRPVVAPKPLATEEARKVLSAIPALAPLAPQFTPFTDADADAALKRGGRSRQSISVWKFLPAAFAWMPTSGRELLVLTGRSGTRAVIAVLERKGERLELAASLVLEEPDATVAVGYSEQHPAQLVWSTCYGCAGEGGAILSREDGRIEFTYR